jgi:hypothetical protein
VKRTHIYVRPGEEFTKCVGCHEDRAAGEPVPTNLNPIAASLPATDLNLTPDQWTIINYENDIGPIVEAKCAVCHYTTYRTREVEDANGFVVSSVTDTIPGPGNLDLSDVLELDMMEGTEFPRGYLNLSGEPMEESANVVSPAVPRRSALIDAVMGVDSHASTGKHPDPAGPYALNDAEIRLFNLWVLLGAQYR